MIFRNGAPQLGVDFATAWEGFNTFLESNTFKLLLVPILGALYAAGRYLGKRKIERTSESEEIKQLHEIVDLRQKMENLNLTTTDVRSFREEVLGKSVKQAVATATYYIERAEYLHEQPRLLLDGDSQVITQADMNAQAFEQFARADNELTSLVLEKMAVYEPEEAAAFQQAQDAWNKWRQAESEWESKVWEGGSMRPLMVATRLESLTRERIAAIHVSGDLERNPEELVVVYKKTPRDLFEHIEPNVTSQRVRDIIGVPHYISGDTWHYRFDELQLQIAIEGETVGEVAAVFVEGKSCSVVLEYESFEFGKLTFADLLELDQDLEICHRGGARTAELYAHLRLGTPSVYSEYFFGAIDHLHGGGRLLQTAFEWDGEQGLVSDPSKVLINWFACVSTTADVPSPSWFIR